MSMRITTQCHAGSSVNARLPSCSQNATVRRVHRQRVIVKATDSARAIEDMLSKASQLMDEVENDVMKKPVQFRQDEEDAELICDESGCSIRTHKENGVSTSPLSRSMRGSSWSIDVHNAVKSDYSVAVSGADWTINITPQELDDLVEAVLGLRNIVNSRMGQGQWCATLQSQAQWRVNGIQVKGTYAEAPDGQAAFNITVNISAKGQRPLELQLPADAVASLIASVEPLLVPAGQA